MHFFFFGHHFKGSAKIENITDCEEHRQEMQLQKLMIVDKC